MIKHNHLVKVYYRDIDKMGIVYYSRYLEYFEEARTELLYSLGLRVKEIEKKGLMLPVITCHCDYKKPGHFEESFFIQSYIDQIPKARLRINYVVKKRISFVSGVNVKVCFSRTLYRSVVAVFGGPITKRFGALRPRTILSIEAP